MKYLFSCIDNKVMRRAWDPPHDTPFKERDKQDDPANVLRTVIYGQVPEIAGPIMGRVPLPGWLMVS